MSSKTRVKESKSSKDRERKQTFEDDYSEKVSHKNISEFRQSLCLRHCFQKSHHLPTKSNCLNKSKLGFSLSDLLDIVRQSRESASRPAVVNILNRLKLKFVSHLISNKMPRAHLFSKPASKWFYGTFLKIYKSSFCMNENKNQSKQYDIIEHTIKIGVNIMIS